MNRNSRTIAYQATERRARDCFAVAMPACQPSPFGAGFRPALERPDLAAWWARRTRQHHRRAAARRRVRVVPSAATIWAVAVVAVVLALALAGVLLALSLDLAGVRFGLGPGGA